CVPRGAEELAFLRAWNIGRAVIADPVRDARAGDGGGESSRVTDDPVGEKAAVRVAGHAQALFVDVVVALCVVDSAHHIVEVGISPAPPGGQEKLLAVSSRSPRIRIYDEVAVGGEKLMLEREVVAVRAVRSAMDRQNQRPRTRWIVAAWLHHPTFDFSTILA